MHERCCGSSHPASGDVDTQTHLGGGLGGNDLSQNFFLSSSEDSFHCIFRRDYTRTGKRKKNEGVFFFCFNLFGNQRAVCHLLRQKFDNLLHYIGFFLNYFLKIWDETAQCRASKKKGSSSSSFDECRAPLRSMMTFYRFVCLLCVGRSTVDMFGFSLFSLSLATNHPVFLFELLAAQSIYSLVNVTLMD